MGNAASVECPVPAEKDFSALRRNSHVLNLAQIETMMSSAMQSSSSNNLGSPPPLDLIIDARKSSALRTVLVDRGLDDPSAELNDNDIATLGLAFCQATAIFIEAQELVGQTVSRLGARIRDSGIPPLSHPLFLVYLAWWNICKKKGEIDTIPCLSSMQENFLSTKHEFSSRPDWSVSDRLEAASALADALKDGDIEPSVAANNMIQLR